LEPLWIASSSSEISDWPASMMSFLDISTQTRAPLFHMPNSMIIEWQTHHCARLHLKMG
jgi:hypothetical protein